MASRCLGSSARSYATAVPLSTKRAPKVPPSVLSTSKSVPQESERRKRVRRDPNHPYPARKAHLYTQYTRLVTNPVPITASDASKQPGPNDTETLTQATPASTSPPAIVLISHENFSVAAFTKLRGEIATALAKTQAARDKLAIAKGDPVPEDRLSARFQIIRPGLFIPVVRKASGKKEGNKLSKMLKGPFAALVLGGTLDPPLLSAVLRVVDKAAPPLPASAQAKAKSKSADDFEPKEKEPAVPKMLVAGAYIDGKVLTNARLREVAKLPRLDELRAQIVGLVGAPGSKIAGVLSSAAGARLALTLEGWKRGLEEGAEATEATKE
ncbi:hypothetical protein FRC04_009424 [Tulasnella sp. 424]|nr:hypothetical protein FRC04_009424 [Tulasnella sp. 424]KAG8971878.1 hypothetical protein FRC05_010546 [Tulasnella sp. 425]